MRRYIISVMVTLTLIVASCSSGGSSSSEARPKGVEPPASSKLSKVQEGMSDEQVQKLIGWPTNQNAYMTGKSWIPFYWGPDTTRTDWKYKGIGRVVFSRNAYSGQLKVIRVDYDPGETGE